MAWTTPKTWAALDTLTASELNTHLRDNLAYLKALTDGILFSGCQAARATNQNISNASATEISFSSESFDYGGWFTATSTDIVVPASAIPTGYTNIAIGVSASVRWTANATGTRYIRLKKNDANFAWLGVGATADIMESSLMDYAVVAAGDVVNLEVEQNCGSTLAMTLATMSVVRVGIVS